MLFDLGGNVRLASKQIKYIVSSILDTFAHVVLVLEMIKTDRNLQMSPVIRLHTTSVC